VPGSATSSARALQTATLSSLTGPNPRAASTAANSLAPRHFWEGHPPQRPSRSGRRDNEMRSAANQERAVKLSRDPGMRRRAFELAFLSRAHTMGHHHMGTPDGILGPPATAARPIVPTTMPTVQRNRLKWRRRKLRATAKARARTPANQGRAGLFRSVACARKATPGRICCICSFQTLVLEPPTSRLMRRTKSRPNCGRLWVRITEAW
jgi:hypothetical protein